MSDLHERIAERAKRREGHMLPVEESPRVLAAFEAVALADDPEPVSFVSQAPPYMQPRWQRWRKRQDARDHLRDVLGGAK